MHYPLGPEQLRSNRMSVERASRGFRSSQSKQQKRSTTNSNERSGPAEESFCAPEVARRTAALLASLGHI